MRKFTFHSNSTLFASGTAQMEHKHTFSTPDMLNANITWNISNATVNLSFNTLYRETAAVCLLVEWQVRVRARMLKYFDCIQTHSLMVVLYFLSFIRTSSHALFYLRWCRIQNEIHGAFLLEMSFSLWQQRRKREREGDGKKQ